MTGPSDTTLMPAASAVLAPKDAVAATGADGASPQFDAPATPERVLMAIEELRGRYC